MAAFFIFAPANHCTFEPCQSWQWATFLHKKIRTQADSFSLATQRRKAGLLSRQDEA